jgi:hypothetical protein
MVLVALQGGRAYCSCRADGPRTARCFLS